MLKFNGTGSAFNTQLGNNSAYICHKNSLLLIDCGGTVFERLMKNDILTGLEQLHVFITHRHPDHVGSLGDLIFYSNYILQAQVTVYTGEPDELSTLLSYLGVNTNLYTLVDSQQKKVILHDFEPNLNIKSVSVPHTNKFSCFGYLISSGDDVVYYSGDSRDIPSQILSLFLAGKIDRIYQDTCTNDYPGNVHLPLTNLVSLIPPSERNRVWCMHLDPEFKSETARELGFQVVTVFEQN